MISKIKKRLKNTIIHSIYAILITVVSKMGIRFIRLLADNDNPGCTKYTKRCMANKKSKYYQYNVLGKNMSPCCATHLYEILRDLTALFEKEDIQYFIVYGTLLGAVRHQGIIPWDTDIDIGVERRDRSKILYLLNKVFPGEYLVQDFPEENLIRIYYSPVNELHADIEIWDREGDCIMYKSDLYVGKRVIPFDTVFPLKKYQFYDLQINGPCALDFLDSVYGKNYMTLGIKKYKESALGNILPYQLKNSLRKVLRGKSISLAGKNAPAPLDRSFLGK